MARVYKRRGIRVPIKYKTTTKQGKRDYQKRYMRKYRRIK